MTISELKTVKEHCFNFSPNDNGGESVTLVTKFIDNGDGDVFLNQELTMQFYCNSASFQLIGTTLTPENLRRLANELESARVLARTGLSKKTA